MAKHSIPTKPDHVQWKLRSFTDAEIGDILERSHNFRDLKMARVDRYYAIMARGGWDWGNGEPLIFDGNDRLLNGQHRLAAARRLQAEQGVKCWFWCAIGVDPKSATSMDNGDARKLADYLKSIGAPNYLAAACIVNGDSRIRLSGKTELAPLVQLSSRFDPETKRTSKLRDDPAMGVATYRANKAAVDYWASQMAKFHSAGLPSASLLSAIGYQLAKREEENAKLFFSYLADGAGMKDTDAVLILRNKLIESKVSPSRYLPKIHLVAIVVKAWSAWLRGETIRGGQGLRFTASGPRAEDFPSHIVAKEEVAV